MRVSLPADDYRINYSSRTTGERSISGLQPAALHSAEYTSRWVVVEKHGRSQQQYQCQYQY